MKPLKLTDCQQVLEAFDANLAKSTFREVSLAGSYVEFSTLEGTRFNNVSFDGAQFEECSFVGAAMRSGCCAGMTIDGVQVEALMAAYHASGAVD